MDWHVYEGRIEARPANCVIAPSARLVWRIACACLALMRVERHGTLSMYCASLHTHLLVSRSMNCFRQL